MSPGGMENVLISITSWRAAAAPCLLPTPATSPRCVIDLDLGVKLHPATSLWRVIWRVAQSLKLLHGAFQFFSAVDWHDLLQFRLGRSLTAKATQSVFPI